MSAIKALKDDVELISTLGLLRLRPMEFCLDDHIIWCKGNETVAVSTPKKRAAPPIEADTAVLSINDYRRITQIIADREEQ